ncbi:MAG TPA: ABC transporter permease [Candidatus Hydrogenedentes bacterium]|nr:ABC transporter permease [Candidatus Hydrogenedentota bacterium]HOC71710.1 ABC transporter permease [Candidatus Hydrogenedentota bacterium]HRZ16540.1 ABC transporter permease [Candidatus Hydrogenedentota bacterium]HRZ81150.1 ABC transporter permease [Candidatus Hydrogenedentota bacterium]
MFRGLAAVVYKETRHILRDPRTLFLILLIPCLELIVFGYAVNLDVKHIPTVVFDLDGRRGARELLEAYTSSGCFRIVGHVGSDAALTREIVAGRAKVGIKIPEDYSDRLLEGRGAQVQVFIDGSDSTSAMQALSTSNAIGMIASMRVAAENLGGRLELAVDTRNRVLFNPDMRTANFMVPGLVGVILQVVIMLLTAFAIVREKEHGTLEQLMVTPVSRLGLILGKLVPFFVVGVLEASFVLILMRFLFHVPIAGSLLLLAGFTLLFLFTTLAFGLLVSTFAENQIQALQYAFLVLLPSFLLSGFMFPQETMPQFIYYIGQAVPVTYFLRILRGIILRGAGFADLWQNGAILAGLGVFVLLLASARFRKTLK